MRFKELLDKIKNSSGWWERNRGIDTLDIQIIAGSEQQDWAIALSKKSDGRHTLFFLYKSKRHAPDRWRFICPSKNHVEGFQTFFPAYEKNERVNKGLEKYGSSSESITKITDFTRPRKEGD